VAGMDDADQKRQRRGLGGRGKQEQDEGMAWMGELNRNEDARGLDG
jgi:hypothetical protein